MKTSKKFFINGFILTLTALLMRSISLAFNVYVSGSIGSEAVGIFGLVMSVYLFAVTVATSGLNLAVTRIISEELATGSSLSVRKVARVCIFFALFLGVFAGVLVCFGADFIVSTFLHDKISSAPLYFIAVALPFIAVSSSINGYFMAVRKSFPTASSQLFELLIKIFATCILLPIFLPKGVEFACLALIIADFISEVCSFLYIFVFYLVDIRIFKLNRSCDETSYFKRILKISVPVALTSYVRSGLSTFKQLLIPLRLEMSGLSCSSALSTYGIIGGMAMPVIMFPCVFINSFSMLLVPEFSHFHVKGNFDRINRITSKIFSLTSVFSICISGLFFCFSDDLSMLIYGNTDTSFFLKIFCPLIFFMYLDNVIDGILKGLDKQVGVMVCNILDLFVSISFIYFLLPVFGINGYVAVIFISELLNFFVSLFLLIKVTKLKFKFFDWVFKPLFAVLLSCLFSYFCGGVFASFDLFWQVVLQCLAFVLVYFAVVSFKLEKVFRRIVFIRF